jgi:hypothetical protein
MDIVTIDDPRYADYEDLILRRDQVKKEAFEASQDYIRRFGQLINDRFAAEIACIREKKIIAYCQRMLNRNLPIEDTKLDNFIEREMNEYQAQLDAMIAEKAAIDKANQSVSEYQMSQIRSIYRQIAKRIHPDIAPDLFAHPDVQDLWAKTNSDYNCNDYYGIKDDQVTLNRLLERYQGEGLSLDIPDIASCLDRLRKEIAEVTSRDPYLYRELLADEDACLEKEETLRKDIKDYQDYLVTLKKETAAFPIKKVGN